jgi:hypothetical protein
VKDRYLKDLILSAREEETMEPFQPKFILCPIDFSEPATLALYYGKHLATCFGARLTVLYADPFSPPPYFTSGQVEDLAKTIEHFKGAALEYLTRYVSEHIGGSGEVEIVVAENQTVPAILLMAEEKKVDLDTDMQRSIAHQANAERERPRQQGTRPKRQILSVYILQPCIFGAFRT